MSKLKIFFALLLLLLGAKQSFAAQISLSPAELDLQLEAGERRVLSFTLARETAGPAQVFLVKVEGDSEYLSAWKKEFQIPSGQLEAVYRCVLDTTAAFLGEHNLQLTFLPQSEDNFLNFGTTANVRFEVLEEVIKPFQFNEIGDFSQYLEISTPTFAKEIVNTGDTLSFNFEISNKTDELLEQVAYGVEVFYKNRLLDSQQMLEVDVFEAKQSKMYTYDYTFDKIGPHRIEISVGDLSQNVQVRVYPKKVTILLVSGVLILLLGLFYWSRKSLKAKHAAGDLGSMNWAEDSGITAFFSVVSHYKIFIVSERIIKSVASICGFRDAACF
ncbi:MAG: hypothetical protein PHU71_01280 [Candidatus Gracilibacteria bacterium]|nr:hypothetical protein [Candidatus Gracilibacteria bacterium]